MRKIRLTESQFNRIVNKAVRQSLNEINFLQKISDKVLGTNYGEMEQYYAQKNQPQQKAIKRQQQTTLQSNDIAKGQQLAQEYWNARARGDESKASSAYYDMQKGSSTLKRAFDNMIGDLQDRLRQSRSYTPSMGY